MTFLQMAQRLRQEVGGAGSGPSSVINQTGEYRRFVDWVAAADEDVQRKHNHWRFMVRNFTLNTVANQGSYLASACTPPVTNLRDWNRDSFKIFLLSAGVGNETCLAFIDYQDWYRIYNTGPQSSSRPLHFTIGNDLSIRLGPAPNDVYRISGEYGKSVTTLTADASVPVYPAEFHMLAVYRAMMRFARYSGAPEIYADAKIEYRRMLNEMEGAQLPDVTIDGALV